MKSMFSLSRPSFVLREQRLRRDSRAITERDRERGGRCRVVVGIKIHPADRPLEREACALQKKKKKKTAKKNSRSLPPHSSSSSSSSSFPLKRTDNAARTQNRLFQVKEKVVRAHKHHMPHIHNTEWETSKIKIKIYLHTFLHHNQF
jgi:hypothetical protein